MAEHKKGFFAVFLAIFFLGVMFILFFGSIYFIIYSFKAQRWFETAIGIYLTLWFGFTVVFRVTYHFLESMRDKVQAYIHTKKKKNIKKLKQIQEIKYPEA